MTPQEAFDKMTPKQQRDWARAALEFVALDQITCECGGHQKFNPMAEHNHQFDPCDKCGSTKQIWDK